MILRHRKPKWKHPKSTKEHHTKSKWPRKCDKAKRKEPVSHGGSFSPSDLKVLKQEPTSTYKKKKKHKRKSDLQSEELKFDPSIGISNYNSYSICTLMSNDTPASSKLHKTNEFKTTPKYLVSKQNRSIKLYSVDKLKSKIGDELKEKPNCGRKCKSYNSQRNSQSKYVYAENVKQDTKYKSCEKYYSDESLKNSTDKSERILKRTTDLIEVDMKLDIEIKITLKQKKLDDLRRLIEESETSLYMHLEIERRNRMDDIIKRYEMDDRDDEIDLESMTISTSKGKWEKLSSHHFRPRPQCMSNKTLSFIKLIKRLSKQERVLIKGLKKMKKKISKGYNLYSSPDSLNKSNRSSDLCVSKNYDPQDSLPIASDTVKASIKVHSKASYSNSLLKETDVFEAGKLSDSDESHTTLPLPTFQDCTTSQQVGERNITSSKESDSPFASKNNIKKYNFNCNALLNRDVLKYSSATLKTHYDSVTQASKLTVLNSSSKKYSSNIILDSCRTINNHTSASKSNCNEKEYCSNRNVTSNKGDALKNGNVSSKMCIDSVSTSAPKNLDNFTDKDMIHRYDMSYHIHRYVDFVVTKSNSTDQRNILCNQPTLRSKYKNCRPVQDKSQKLISDLPLNNKKVLRSAYKNEVVKSPKRKRSEKDLSSVTEDCLGFSSKTKRTPRRCESTSKNGKKFKRYDLFFANIPYDTLTM